MRGLTPEELELVAGGYDTAYTNVTGTGGVSEQDDPFALSLSVGALHGTGYGDTVAHAAPAHYAVVNNPAMTFDNLDHVEAGVSAMTTRDAADSHLRPGEMDEIGANAGNHAVEQNLVVLTIEDSAGVAHSYSYAPESYYRSLNPMMTAAAAHLSADGVTSASVSPSRGVISAQSG